MNNTMIGVAYALTTVDSHDQAMRAISEQVGIAQWPQVRTALPSPDALFWANLWATMRQLKFVDYAEAVHDARTFLRENLDDLLAWEQRLKEQEGE